MKPNIDFDTSELLLVFLSAHLANPCPQTRIITKYNVAIHSPSSSSTASSAAPTAAATANAPANPAKATLVLKAYDPRSGTCLKYRTDKAAEVGRLVGALGRLARGMCGLAHAEGPGAAAEERRVEGVEEADRDGDGDAGTGASTPAVVTDTGTGTTTAGVGGAGPKGGGGGGGGKKKKKGGRR